MIIGCLRVGKSNSIIAIIALFECPNARRNHFIIRKTNRPPTMTRLKFSAGSKRLVLPCDRSVYRSKTQHGFNSFVPVLKSISSLQYRHPSPSPVVIPGNRSTHNKSSAAIIAIGFWMYGIAAGTNTLPNYPTLETSRVWTLDVVQRIRNIRQSITPSCWSEY